MNKEDQALLDDANNIETKYFDTVLDTFNSTFTSGVNLAINSASSATFPDCFDFNYINLDIIEDIIIDSVNDLSEEVLELLLGQSFYNGYKSDKYQVKRLKLLSKGYEHVRDLAYKKINELQTL